MQSGMQMVQPCLTDGEKLIFICNCEIGHCSFLAFAVQQDPRLETAHPNAGYKTPQYVFTTDLNFGFSFLN